MVSVKETDVAKLYSELREIVVACRKKHGDDIPAEVAEVVFIAEKQGLLSKLGQSLAIRGIRELCYEDRHAENMHLRRQLGVAGSLPKCVSARSPAVQDVCRSLYDYYIGGMRLGSIRGEDLEAIGKSEQAIGRGHICQGELALKLRPLVPDGKRVQDVVPEKKLRTIYQQVFA